MGEGHNERPHHDFLPGHRVAGRGTRPAGLRGSAGEIVEVQGGHIMRSTGRKDRHSKVCTAKGPRDRRVRLSAHTAIQFYDVQDRLGFDRPSKAVDWLIKNAKAAIDELAELPPWRPNVGTSATATPVDPSPSNYAFGGAGIGILPPSLDSDAIADTIKSFFPATAGSSSYPHDEDLRLSLQSFHYPIPLHHNHRGEGDPVAEQASFMGSSTPLMLDPAAWSDHNPRAINWVAADSSDGNGSGGGGYEFTIPAPAPQQTQGAMPMHHQHVAGHGFFLAQRGPLQSSNPPLARTWTDTVDHSVPSGFASFRIPARIRGEEEEHDGIANLPMVASRR